MQFSHVTDLFLNLQGQADIPAEEELRRLPLWVQHSQVRHDLRPDAQVLQRLVVRLQLQVCDTQMPVIAAVAIIFLSQRHISN